MGKRSYKLATNLQEQQATGKPQELTENEELRWVDYDALTIKDAYCKENILGETQVTPGKALFSLRHSSKKKSAAWRTEDSEDESENMSDQENALPCSPLANKKRSSNAQKESSKAKEPRSCPPSKRVKEMSVSSCPASAGKAKSTVSSTSSGRPSRAATGRAVNSPMPLRKQVLSARVTPLKAVDTNEELPERTTRSGRVIGTPGSEAKSDTLPTKRAKSAEIESSAPTSARPKRSSSRPAVQQTVTPSKKTLVSNSTKKQALKVESSALKSARSAKSTSRAAPVTKTPSKVSKNATPNTARRSKRLSGKSSPLQSESETSSEEEDDDDDDVVVAKETLSVRKKRVAMTKVQTPKTVRYEKKRVAVNNLAKVLDDASDSDPSDSDQDEEEEVNEEEQQNAADLAGPSYQSYFEDIHGLKSLKTSDHSLSKLPVLDPQEYLQSLERLAQENQPLIQEQHARVSEFFNDWFFESQHGFNLLFYGYGSKKDLLNEFCQTYFKGSPVLTVNGFFPNLNVKTLFDMILRLIEHQGPKGTAQDQLSLIHTYFTKESRKVPNLVLLIHNIDGPSLRNAKTQSLLSVLADTPNIRLIASIDHINAPLLWDSVLTKRFNWIWHDATSFAPWIQETTFETSILIKSSSLGPRGVIYVLKSLNANARGIFGILAKHQIVASSDEDSIPGSSGTGMPYSTLYQEACNYLYVTNELTFRTLLTEFKDHKIMVMKKGGDGVDMLEIPLDVDALISLVEDMAL